ncbi:flagellar hook-basal body complex protein FliE [Pseudomonas aeruginosa]
MTVSAINQSLQAMQAMAKQASGNTGENLGAVQGSLAFSDALQDSLRKVSGAQKAAEAKAQAFQLGDPRVTLDETMVDMQKASLGFTMATQVRNKLVDAYKQIMGMQV